MSERSEERRYEGLSPFELKNKLIEMANAEAATAESTAMMLNAGRGNPNWVAVAPRRAFGELHRFALDESERTSLEPGFGGTPERSGIADRLREHLTQPGAQGAELLSATLDLAEHRFRFDLDLFVTELCDAILGDHYPVPDRMLQHCERVVDAYLAREMAGGSWPDGDFDLFATEGGTAAMTYVFQSLVENKLIHPGDTIALGTPIFTPYLEIPYLNDYRLIELEIEQDENDDWRFPASEIDKLADPSVKALFVVNPSNPTSRAMHSDTLDALAELVATKRPDLVFLTDDVYGTFVDGFRSLASIAPKNTILVYSWSKFFGATGWRLGVIGLHQDNVLDAAIRALPQADQDALTERYHTVFLDPAGTKLIDRMVADSRTVALHHTAGLSTPQQVMMTLFSLHSLTDDDRAYQHAAQGIVTRRINGLYEGLGVDYVDSSYDTHYYNTIDIPTLAADRFGEQFATWLRDEHEPIDFVWRLAEEYGVVLMDGGGFDAPQMSIRVSLANLPSDAYPKIGRAVSELLADYHASYEASSGSAT